MYDYYAECCYAECHFAECLGATQDNIEKDKFADINKTLSVSQHLIWLFLKAIQ
jgi:hypothetical protein